jgi:mono/diheme cytochrome c family protein
MLPKGTRRFYFSLQLIVSTLLFLAVFSLASFPLKAEVSAASGEKIYKQYCTSCHTAAPFEKKLVGPALKDVHTRRSEEWLIKWIRNNAALRASGDADAIAIWQEYGKNEMPSFLSFTDDEIKSILAYIASPPVAAPASTTTATPGAPAGESSSVWIYLVIVALLIIMIMLIRANYALKRMAMAKDGLEEPDNRPWGKRLTSTKAYFAYGLILVFLAGWTFTDSAIRLGHSKNYQPAQPVAFPHDLHAGTMQINCLYCHSGAEKGKVAGIPTVGTCMNCHKGVQQGESEAGTAEIQKIYAAFENNQPIQWVRIHNLPDHVYFNHAQHVTVGKIACQTCHGPVETMKEMYQFSSLSMGWCINCHRQTEVQFQDNEYYSMFTDLHEKVKKDTSFKVTGAMLGGEECQKCHY